MSLSLTCRLFTPLPPPPLQSPPQPPPVHRSTTAHRHYHHPHHHHRPTIYITTPLPTPQPTATVTPPHRDHTYRRHHHPRPSQPPGCVWGLAPAEGAFRFAYNRQGVCLVVQLAPT
nr:hypothetical protein [Tanacetum cinerariifolium]